MGACSHLCAQASIKTARPDHRSTTHSSDLRATNIYQAPHKDLQQLSFFLFLAHFHSTNMQVPARPLGSVCGYSVRPGASLHTDYGSTHCSVSPTKPSTGKSFTIDALLSKPDTIRREKADFTETVKYPSAVSSVYPVHGPMHSSLPHYVYSPSMVQTQPGYPVYYCPPYGYQTAYRGPLYAQGKYCDSRNRVLYKILYFA